MKKFNHKRFLWNRDHNFKNFKNKTITINELADFLNCTIQTDLTNVVVDKNGLLVLSSLITLNKKDFLIVAKNNNDVEDEALDSLVLSAGSYKEINFGWLIDQSFYYKVNDTLTKQWAEDLHEKNSEGWPDGVNINIGDKLTNPSSWVFSDDPDEILKATYYRAQLASFSGWSNGANKPLEFLSWPNLVQDQSDEQLYFQNRGQMDWGWHTNSWGVMNWGTNGPSLIGITAGITPDGTLVDNIFTYQGSEYLIPGREGILFRIHRAPARDLELPQAIFDAQAKTGEIVDLQDLFGYVPTSPFLFDGMRVYTNLDDYKQGYRVQLSTNEVSLYPWVEISTKPETNPEISSLLLESYQFFKYFYSSKDLNKEFKMTDSKRYATYWGEKVGVWKDVDWDKETRNDGVFKAKEIEKTYRYQASLNFPQVELSQFGYLDNVTPLFLDAGSNLVVQNCTYIHNIKADSSKSEDRVSFNLKKITPLQRNPEKWIRYPASESSPELYLHIQLLLNNFCLLPGEKLNDLFRWTEELQQFHSRTYGKDVGSNKKNWEVRQSNFLGYRILLGWDSYLIDKNTSEFLFPTDARDVDPIIVEVAGKQASLQPFAPEGSWDLLANRIVPLSCLLLFKTETKQANRPNCFSFKDAEYYKEGDFPVILFNKPLTPELIPDNATTFATAPVYYWPCLSDETRLLIRFFIAENDPPYGWNNESHKEIAKEREYGFRKEGQDSGAIALFVEPNTQMANFNNGNQYGWYWTDCSVEFKWEYDAVTQKNNLSFINYDLKNKKLVIQKDQNPASYWSEQAKPLSNHNHKFDTTSSSQFYFYLDDQLVFKLNPSLFGNHIWKIYTNNEVYCDGEIYGVWTEDGIKPYNKE